MKKIVLCILGTLIILFTACKKDSEEQKNKKNSEQEVNYDSLAVQLVKVKDKLFNVPSPFEVSKFIEKNKIAFNSELLHKPSEYSKYLTSFKQALNLGVYGSNLATLFVYDQLSLSAQYFSVVKKLSEQLGIFNSLDQSLFERIEKNSQNKDSLIYLVSVVYQEIDAYLSENDQQEIAILILVGGWIESMYLMTQLYTIYNNSELLDKIAQQKIPLYNIVDLYSPYSNKSNEYDTLLRSLELLRLEFSKIEENYVFKKPEVFPDKHLTVINSETYYTLDNKTIKNITDQIYLLRKWVTK